MTITDRLIGAVSPGWAARRVRSRIHFHQLLEASGRMGFSYDGATRGRFGRGLPNERESANTAIRDGLAAIRARNQDAVDNDPFIGGACRKLVLNAVGFGLEPKILDPALKDAWDAWVFESDSQEETDWHGQTRAVARSVFSGGEALGLFTTAPSKEGKVPLRVRILEGDYCDHSKELQTDTHRTIMGVNFDRRTGKKAGFWLFPEHPGDDYSAGYATSAFYQAERVVHTYEPMRSGQVRGVPRGTPAVMYRHHLGSFLRADLIAKEMSAHSVMVIKNENEPSSGHYGAELEVDGSSTGDPDEEVWRPGARLELEKGQEAQFNAPPMSPGFAEFVRTHHHAIASAWGLPYWMLTGDLNGASYSSNRTGLLDFRKELEGFQVDTLVARWARPVFRAFNKSAIAAGVTKAWEPNVAWALPVVEDADPLKGAMARKLDVRSGFQGHQAAVARLGGDLADIIKDTEERNRLVDAAKVVFDSDPRKVGGSGGVQGQDPNAIGEDDELTALDQAALRLIADAE